MLFVPFDFSALFVRQIERLRAVFALVPEYLRGDAAGADINYMDYGVQLGRRFRALKAWMVWRAFGREGIAARLREHMRLARLWASWVEAEPRLELRAPVVMGVVCFGPATRDREATAALSRRIVEEINASGRAYLTLTELRGETAMRIGLGNILTNEGHLEAVWRMILDKLP